MILKINRNKKRAFDHTPRGIENQKAKELRVI